MLLIKLSAGDIRIIEGARTTEEKLGALELVKTAIQRFQALKAFGTTAKPNISERFRWEAAWKICKEVLGDRIYKPPCPDYTWFQRVSGTIRREGMDEAYVRQLAEYGRDHLAGSIKFEFLICQHHRIMAGEFNQTSTHASANKNERSEPLQELARCQLPELD